MPTVGDMPMTESPPTTPDEIAKANDARLTEEANVLLENDCLGYLPGAGPAECVHVACRGQYLRHRLVHHRRPKPEL